MTPFQEFLFEVVSFLLGVALCIGTSVAGAIGMYFLLIDTELAREVVLLISTGIAALGMPLFMIWNDFSVRIWAQWKFGIKRRK